MSKPLKCQQEMTSAIATTEMMLVRWAMGVSLMKVGYLGGSKGGADCERRLEWFGYLKGRLKTGNVRAVAIMKMKGSAQVEMEL